MKISQYIMYIAIGWLLIQMEFQIYTQVRFFDYVPFIIIFPFFLILRLSIHKQLKKEYPIYIIGVIIMYIYSLYSDAYPYLLITTIICFIWYSRNHLQEQVGYKLFASLFVMYSIFFGARLVHFVIIYNLDIDFITAVIVNTMSVAVINTIIAYFVIQFKRDLNFEIIE